MKEETERAKEMMDLVAKLQTQQTEESVAACEQIKRGLEATLKKLGSLAADVSRVTGDPNSDLTFVQRLFIMFRPVGVREYIIHALAYMATAGATLLFLFRDQLQSKFPHGFADLIVLDCYGLVAFRAWALAERRWRYGHEPVSDVLRDAFVARKPLNWQMRTAQISMWFCLFWLIEGAEDVITAIINGTHAIKVIAGLLPPAMALLATVLCRAWATTELEFAVAGSKHRSWRLVYSLPKNQSSLVWFVRIVHVVVLPSPFLLIFMTTPEPVDVIGFISTTLLSVAACNQWLVLLPQTVITAAQPARTAMVGAAAA
jgi:hypothetical protein